MLSGPGNTRPQYQHYSGHSHHPPAWMSMMNTLNVLSGRFIQRHLTLVWSGAELWQLPMVEQVPCHWHTGTGHQACHKRSIHLKLKISTRKWENGPRKTRLAMHWFMMSSDGPLKWWKGDWTDRHSATDHDCFLITVHIRAGAGV